MRAVRIYQPGSYNPGDLIALTPEASLHVGIVLRMQVGASLILFCGDNREFEAHIDTIKKKQVMVVIDSIKEMSRESPVGIHLAQAVSKGDRMEFVMQKAVELGVASITPIITERCVVKLDKERMAKKLHQWQAIVIGACEQSGRNIIPPVHQFTPYPSYIANEQAELKFLLNPQEIKNWRDYQLKSTKIALLIGPEGGLTPNEVQSASEYGFQFLALGPRILRTETAAIAALSVLQAVGGDL
jgi:16S rRNA (uracil1498-N3)-methyltransferase